ncbi:TolC family protein [Aquabacterium sp.]|uniref:efflux transporter outer membrane subunit n=1 Tax=Aquabacterium sp. TaxID=1872578 RepID=UPI0024894D54|nr:TolC family protein [Aquabacterium sp.]MDI1261111.1 TolC family protein [Aquabacterium sp.]
MSFPPLRLQQLPPALALCLATLLSACATPPPEPPVVSATQDARFRHAEATTPEPDATWWRSFNDAALEALIRRAQSANHDVRIAVQRVWQARAGHTAMASRLWPTVALTGSASSERSGLPDQVKQGKPDTRAYRGALDLGWELDVFGAARASADAAELDALTAEDGVDTALWLVSSEVARHYIVWQSARLRLVKLEALLKAQADTERLTRSRESAGQASRFDVARAAGEVQSLAAQLPPLRTLVAVSETQLAVLVGTNPNQPLPELASSGAPGLPTPPRLSAKQPVELLLRRPDLRVAQKQFMAEAARLRESQADRWPKFFLAAAFGRQDLRLNALDLSPVRYSTAALAFTMPLFDAGRLRAAVERQSAKERMATLQYEKAVLGAVKDVDDSLVALAQERDRSTALDATTRARRTGLHHAESLHREGQIDLLQLIDAQRGVLAAELSAIDGQAQLALNTVQLAQALGGGWQDTPSANTKPPTSLAPESLP